MNESEYTIFYGLVIAGCSEDEAYAKVDWDAYEEETGPLTQLEKLETIYCLMYLNPSLSIDECLAKRVCNISRNTTMVHRGKYDEAERFIQISEELFKNDIRARIFMSCLSEIWIDDYVVIKNGETNMVFGKH
jgi:hypothetical protein